TESCGPTTASSWPSVPRTATERRSPLRSANAWNIPCSASVSRRCAATETWRATASARALRPSIMAPCRSGTSPRAPAASKTLTVRLARARLIRKAEYRCLTKTSHFFGVRRFSAALVSLSSPKAALQRGTPKKEKPKRRKSAALQSNKQPRTPDWHLTKDGPQFFFPRAVRLVLAVPTMLLAGRIPVVQDRQQIELLPDGDSADQTGQPV